MPPPPEQQEQDDFDAAALLLLLPLVIVTWRKYAPRKYRARPSPDGLVAVLNGLKREAREQSQLLLNRRITFPEWQYNVKRLMDITFILSVAASAGAWQLTTLNLELASEEWRKQRKFYANFERQMQTGEQKPNGTLLVRTALYISAGWAMLQDIGRMLSVRGEKNEERRVLGVADNFSDCIEWAGLGCQPIGTLPPLGASICRSNCHCHFEQR